MMGRISARCSRCATTSIVSLRPPAASKIDAAAALDLTTMLPWLEASGAADISSSICATALLGALCAVSLTSLRLCRAARPSAASDGGLPAFDAFGAAGRALRCAFPGGTSGEAISTSGEPKAPRAARSRSSSSATRGPSGVCERSPSATISWSSCESVDCCDSPGT